MNTGKTVVTPKSSGFDVLRLNAVLRIRVPAIIITGPDEAGSAARTSGPGAAGNRLKPPGETVLVRATGRACRRNRPAA